MSNKTVTISIFAVVLLLFAGYFLAFYIAFPFGQPIKSELENIIMYANEEKWLEVSETLEDLENDWGKAKKLLSLNYAEADYSMFLEYLGRLKTSTKFEEKSQVTTDAAAALALWENFIRVIPEP